MIHPSYVELMKVVNDGVEIGEEPVVNSRYSIVCAVAKRARQIINESHRGGEELAPTQKPLSMAVDELNDGRLKILSDDEVESFNIEMSRIEESSERAKEKYEEIRSLREQADAEAAALAEEEGEYEAVPEEEDAPEGAEASGEDEAPAAEEFEAEEAAD